MLGGLVGDSAGPRAPAYLAAWGSVASTLSLIFFLPGMASIPVASISIFVCAYGSNFSGCWCAWMHCFRTCILLDMHHIERMPLTLLVPQFAKSGGPLHGAFRPDYESICAGVAAKDQSPDERAKLNASPNKRQRMSEIFAVCMQQSVRELIGVKFLLGCVSGIQNAALPLILSNNLQLSVVQVGYVVSYIGLIGFFGTPLSHHSQIATLG